MAARVGVPLPSGVPTLARTSPIAGVGRAVIGTSNRAYVAELHESLSAGNSVSEAKIPVDAGFSKNERVAATTGFHLSTGSCQGKSSSPMLPDTSNTNARYTGRSFADCVLATQVLGPPAVPSTGIVLPTEVSMSRPELPPLPPLV